MSIQLYLAYLAACIVIVIVPGPTTTLVIANSLTHGTRAGLLNVAGTQLGVAGMVVVLAVGLSSTMQALGHWFDWLRLAGAVYLIWLGWKLLRSSGDLAAARARGKPRGGFFLQGLLVALSNPKMLLFFSAFIPQFIDPAAGLPASGADPGRHRHDLCCLLRQHLCLSQRPCRPAHLAAPGAADIALQRLLPHRRRHLAGPVAEPVTGPRPRHSRESGEVDSHLKCNS